MNYKLLFMVCFIVQSIQGHRDKVTLQIYYETYDFDSRLLIATDLKEAVDLLDMEGIAVEMYAYGNAETHVVDGKYEFTCENGPEECLGNKFDACAVEILDIHKAIALINCVIDPWNGLNGEYDSTSYSYKMCLQNMESQNQNKGLTTNKVHECSVSERGSELLRRNGKATGYVTPKQLPFVLINGKEWNIDDNVTLFVALCAALEEIGFIRPKYCY